jgi:hypothetical protein
MNNMEKKKKITHTGWWGKEEFEVNDVKRYFGAYDIYGLYKLFDCSGTILYINTQKKRRIFGTRIEFKKI